ncbi:hypothetical protein BC939DRAFT_521179 [Gamsiella multidivaricata]|uniref:uncharacterized protein n=1 Tax=Gamsiella multidivaricata TaxID=101098 RepID=UPI00221F0E52|nr:uncharacterized protein BC939DRAFT_521179 [Gamsiella multidivaricata]KAI7819176.1 hypothetical protein BC939DRAFT_521179 [Gamsiella multidivaricata]
MPLAGPLLTQLSKEKTGWRAKIPMLQDNQQRPESAAAPPSPSTPRTSSSAHVQITSSFSLGRPGSTRTSSSPSQSRLPQLLPQPTLQQLQQRHDHRKTLSVGYTPLQSNSVLHRQRVDGVEMEYASKGQDTRLLSLFQKARSQTPFSRATPASSPSLSTGRRVPSPKHQSPATPQSPSRICRGVFSESGQPIDFVDSRQELIQYLRVKAEETRLELLALEQLERDVIEQDDRGDRDDRDDRDNILPPFLLQPSSMISPTDNINQRLSSRLPVIHQRNENSKLMQRDCVTEYDHRQSVSFQYSPANQLLQYNQQPQQRPFQRLLMQPPAKPAVGSQVSLTQPLSRIQPEQVSRRSQGTINCALSPSSPYSSTSPLISPLSGKAVVLARVNTQARSVADSAFLESKQQSSRVKDWGPALKVAGSYKEFEAPDDYASDDNLRDVTLSEMMQRHLALLSDSDELYSGHSSNNQGSRQENDSESEDGWHQADMTFTDRTYHFVSMLEHDYDHLKVKNQEVPSLLAETIPENDFGDISFRTCAELESTAHGNISSSMQERHQRSFQLPAVAPQEGAVTNEFLKSLQPQPLSPENQRFTFGNQQSTFAPATNTTMANTLSGHPLPLPASIITTRGRFQQTPQQQPKLDDRTSAQHQPRAGQAVSWSPSTSLGAAKFSSQSSLASASWSDVGTPDSVYYSARENLMDSVQAEGSPKPPSPVIASMALSRYQPLDMIIIRPAKAAVRSPTDEDSLSWSSPSPTLSIESNRSTSSSWSWYWPSPSYHSRSNSPTPYFFDELRTKHGQVHSSKRLKARLPFTLQNASTLSERAPPLGGAHIKSRSMSSLIKHRNGWLGFQALDVRMVASGRCHIVVVTRSNQVFSCWENDEENSNYANDDNSMKKAGVSEMEETLGRKTKAQIDPTFLPELVQIQEDVDTLPFKIVKIACSDSATFLLTENGILWGWGSFKDAAGRRVGLLSQKSASRPIQICSQQIKDIVCGRNHILILSFSGEVISWGANDHGQLGRSISSVSGTSTSQEQQDFDLSPHFIETLPWRIVGIGAGKLSSFAWDEEKLYGWGDNTYGQLGRAPASNVTTTRIKEQYPKDASAKSCSEQKVIVESPREISLHWKGKSIRQVQGGERHTVILMMSGLVIAMGNDDFGQLGIASPPSSSLSLSSFPNSALTPGSPWLSAKAPACEKTESVDSTLSDKSKTRLFPALVRIGPGMKEICCGDFHTVICSDSGQMFIWGLGYVGVLAIHNLRSLDETLSKTDMRFGGNKVSVASVVETARKVVAVSTMRSGIAIALVSSN